MLRILRKVSGAAAGLLFAGLSFAAVPAHPGVVNYLEGQASIAGQPIDVTQMGSVDVQPGQELSTGAGKAELLLTPGVFLRVGDHSLLRLETAGLTDTRVELIRGEALLEATQVNKDSAVRVDEAGATTTIKKEGLYKFNADQPRVSVIDGKAEVTQSDQTVDLKKGRTTVVGTAPLKVEKFDRKQEDALYAWSNVRSQQLSAASYSSAKTVIVNNSGWGGGWYFNPYFGYYSWLPGDGLFYNPFGYAFYSPLYVYRNPVIVTGPRAGFYGRSPAFRTSGGFAGRPAAPAFHSMGGMRHMGGGGFRHR